MNRTRGDGGAVAPGTGGGATAPTTVVTPSATDVVPGGGELALDDVLDADGDGDGDGSAGDGKPAEGAVAGDGKAPAGKQGAAGDVKPETDPDGLGAIRDLFDEDKKPAWMEVLEIELERSGKPFFAEVTADDLAGMDPKVQKLVMNLVQAQRLAEPKLLEQQQKQTARETAAAAAERRAVEARAKLWGIGKDKALREWLETRKPKGDQPDPFTPEGQVWLIKMQTYEEQKAFLDQWEQAAKRETDALQQADQQVAADRLLEETATYMDANAEDFDNPVIYERIQGLLKKTTPAGAKQSTLSVPEAHSLVMAQLATEGNTEARKTAQQRARSRIRPGKGALTGPPPTPKFTSEDERLEFYDRYPDAHERDLKKLIARGTSY